MFSSRSACSSFSLRITPASLTPANSLIWSARVLSISSAIFFSSCFFDKSDLFANFLSASTSLALASSASLLAFIVARSASVVLTPAPVSGSFQIFFAVFCRPLAISICFLASSLPIAACLAY